MTFTIIVTLNKKDHRLTVSRIYQSDQIERYKVSGKNRYIILQTNAPLLNKNPFKKRKGAWKLIEGSGIFDETGVREICETIEEWLGKYGS